MYLITIIRYQTWRGPSCSKSRVQSEHSLLDTCFTWVREFDRGPDTVWECGHSGLDIWPRVYSRGQDTALHPGLGPVLLAPSVMWGERWDWSLDRPQCPKYRAGHHKAPWDQHQYKELHREAIHNTICTTPQRDRERLSQTRPSPCWFFSGRGGAPGFWKENKDTFPENKVFLFSNS